MKHNVLTVAHASLALVWIKVVDLFSCMPWILTQGDLRANLDALRAEVAANVTDPVASRIKARLDAGFNVEEILDVLRLMLEAGWSTMGVEQQHASLKLMLAKHPQLST